MYRGIETLVRYLYSFSFYPFLCLFPVTLLKSENFSEVFQKLFKLESWDLYTFGKLVYVYHGIENTAHCS